MTNTTVPSEIATRIMNDPEFLVALTQEIKFREQHNESGVVNLLETDPTKWDEDDWSDVESLYIENQA